MRDRIRRGMFLHHNSGATPDRAATQGVNLMSKFKNLAIAALVVLAASSTTFAQAKNVILMISDGIGFNGWEAAKYYQGGLPYDNADFNFYGMTTYMHNVYDHDEGRILLSNGEANGTDSATKNWSAVPQGYDPAQMWSDFNYHRGSYSGDYNKFTDSAAAATAMYTGQKTYNSAVSYSVDGQEIKSFYEYAAEAGMATGSVTSVQLNHATPSCVDAHSFYRYNKDDLGHDMVTSDLDVIMGGDTYIDGSDYQDHGNGGGVAGWKADAAARGFTVIDENDLTDWTDLADMDGSFKSGAVPTKIAGTFNGSTLDGRTTPTLEQMTKGAIEVLSQNANGFAMMVEGGAVDWQNHANDIGLMMREQVDFDNSVQAVMDWVDANSNWDETLLIVTSDHECGGIWGPNTVTDFGTLDSGDDDGHLDDVINATWQNVVADTDPGTPGNQPGVQYVSGGHTNALVPLWARGNGADLFDSLVDGIDADAANFWTQFGGGWNGSYVDNTDVFSVMMDASGVPEPASIGLIALGGLALIRRRRSA